MHWLIEVFGSVVGTPSQEALYGFCREHFAWACIIAFLLLLIVGAILVSSVLELVRELARMKGSPRARLYGSIAVLGIGGAILSVFAVVFVLRALEPVPILDSSRIVFIREPVVLTWTFGGGKPNERVFYDIQVADNQDFARSTTERSDGNAWYSYRHEGEQWWRVRAETESGAQGAWSKPLKTTYYENAYSRVKNSKDNHLIVFVSNSVAQGIFRFLDAKGNVTGIDIDLARRTADTLSAEMHKPIKPFFVPVAWKNLLQQPGLGTSDLIISSITKRDSRENKYQIKFSEPYFCTGQSLLYRKNDPSGDKPVREMLWERRTVGYQEGTTSEQLVEKLAADLKDSGQPLQLRTFGEAENMVQSLLAPNSGIQLAVTDTAFAVDRVLKEGSGGLASKPFTESDFPQSVTTEERRDDYAIAVAQAETKLLEYINKAIADLKGNGGLKSIFEKAAKAKFPKASNEERARLYHSTCSERQL